MRILYLRNTGMQCDPHVASIQELAQDKGWTLEVFDYFIENSTLFILKKADEFKPTHVIYLGVCGGPYEPDPLVFWKLKQTAKTIFLCPEASHPDWNRLIAIYQQRGSFDMIVNLDGNDDWGIEPHEPNSQRQLSIMHTTLAIFGQKAYAKYQDYTWDNRPIGVGFCGGSGGPGTMRQQLIDHMKSQNSFHFEEMPFYENPGTYQDYADFLMNCKIIVNAAGSGGDCSFHVKGRVLEAALAGCVLVEQANSPTDIWFDRANYYTFNSPEHCEKDIEGILSTGIDEAKKKATRFAIEVRDKYSPSKLWDEIFTRIK